MAYKDLQDFLKTLEKKGLLKRISAEVDPYLEITAIADEQVKAGGPALLFENVKGSPFPLVINTFGSWERLNLAFGVKHIDEIGREIEDLMDLSQYIGLLDKVKAVPKLAKYAMIFPRPFIGRAPCQEVVEEEPDLEKLPVLHCWPQDGGPFFTLPLVITRDPETGIQNMGMYRLQRYSRNTTGMHWHLHKDGRAIYEKYRALGGKMDVAVALGCDPATLYSATAPLPQGIDEFLLAGFLRKNGVETVKCLNSDIRVPAHAEFILEGYVDVNEPLRQEGPFGDHTGYYSLPDDYPVFHVTTVTRKKKPVYPATIVGKPPMEDCFLGKATERIFLPLIKFQCPEIQDINFPLEGVFHNCVLVSIKKSYPGQPFKVMNTLWGMGQMMYTKMIIIVDHSVDVQDVSTVMWKVFNNIDAGRDLLISPGPLDALDHASPQPHFGRRLGIDATRKGPSDGHFRPWPDDLSLPGEILERVEKRREEYGL